jgi:hypothetical protein
MMNRFLADLRFEPNWLCDCEGRGAPRSGALGGGERVVDPDDGALDGMRTGERVSFFGQSFVWTDGHLTRRELAPLRREGDADADSLAEAMVSSGHKGDVFEFEDESAEPQPWHPAARALADKYSGELPDWVDFALVAEGQDIFTQHLPVCMTWLYYGSLVGGFSFPRITKVLLSTGYLCGSPDKVMTRLMDTFRMILLCMQPGGMAPRNEGWKAAMRVRMLHARVRVMLRGRKYWNEEEWGVPINQEDLCATLLGFSLSTLKGMELMRASPLSTRQREAYMHLWRFIGWVMGISDEHNPCSSYARSVLFSQSFALHQLQPNDDSAKVSGHLLGFMGPKMALYRAQFSRRLLGAELADSLSIGSGNGVYSLRTLIHLWMIRAYTWASCVPLASTVVIHLHRLFIRRILGHISVTEHAVSESPLEKGFSKVADLAHDQKLVPVFDKVQIPSSPLPLLPSSPPPLLPFLNPKPKHSPGNPNPSFWIPRSGSLVLNPSF